MRVTVKLFASLASAAPVAGLPGTRFDVDIPAGASLADLAVQLRLPPGDIKIAFINGIVQPLDCTLQPDDEVGFFPPIGGGSAINEDKEKPMAEILLDVWLYGGLARFGGADSQGSFANPQVRLREGSTIADLLAYLQMPTEERGITFINGDLSAMVGLQPDLVHVLADGDRVAFFHLNTMWPFQYRLGAAMVDEMKEAMLSTRDQGLHHTYDKS